MMASVVPRVMFAGGGTGGHLYPALALADALRELDPRSAVFFVGAERGVEARVLPDRGVPYTLLPLEPIRRSRPWENWRLVPSLTRSLWGIRRAFGEFRPNLVVGTGGYASGPVAGWGVVTGVPVALQEQNSYPGFTTRLLAPRARQVHLAFPEARAYLKPGKNTEVMIHGNPIRPPELGVDRGAARAKFGLAAGTVVLVIGGSQGARPINEALLGDLGEVVAGRLPPPPEGTEILWATGPANFEAVEARLREQGNPAWVHAVPYIEDMQSALASADLAISRAGAMSSAELCAWGIPSIMVPLPHAAANHQYHNAQALANAGAATMIPEPELERGRLWAEVHGLLADPARRLRIAASARERGHPYAAREIAGSLLTILNGSSRRTALSEPLTGKLD